MIDKSKDINKIVPPNISNVKQFWKTTDPCLANGKSKVWNTVEAGFNIGDEWLVLCVAKHENLQPYVNKVCL
jgi:hypothetical protein